MKKYLIICIISFLFALHPDAYASRNIGSFPLPWNETFNVYNYSDLLRNTGNGRIEHDSNGGWENSGCVKIFPGTISHQYYSLGQIVNIGGGNERTVHVRWLQWFGPTFPNDQPAYKGLIMMDGATDSSDRPMIIWNKMAESMNNLIPSSTDDTTRVNYRENTHLATTGASYPNGGEFHVEDFLNQWVCFEYRADATANRNTLYIWTQDGQWNGEYNSVTNSISSSRSIYGIDVLGFYVNYAQSGANPETTFIKIDELAISNQPIGPPIGFAGSASSNPPPDPEPEPDPGVDPSVATGLPWNSDFETGDWTDWAGRNPAGGLTLTTESPHSGNYCSISPLVASTNSDNYIDHYFGNFFTISDGQAVEAVDLTFWVKFAPATYSWSSGTKVALLNLCDSEGRRRYQVYVYVKENGEYAVSNSWIDSWRFFPNDQNMGAPVTVDFGNWEKIRLQTKLNTQGLSDGIIRLWINDELKVSYNDRNIRESTSFSFNKLILSSYTGTDSPTDGSLWHDDWYLTVWTPDIADGDPSPTLSVPGTPGNLQLSLY